MHKLKLASGSVIALDYVRATCSALEDTAHNFVGIGGENWTLDNDTNNFAIKQSWSLVQCLSAIW